MRDLRNSCSAVCLGWHCHVALRSLQYPANALAHRGELLAYITSDRIRSNAQLDGALDYLGKASRCFC